MYVYERRLCRTEKKEQSAKAELIRRIDDIRNRLNTASVNALDVFIKGVISGAKGK